MNVPKTPLEGFLVIEPDFFQDKRGFFLETYQEQRYKDAGIKDQFVQDNHSRSNKGVLRGMHFQVKHPQAKIVTVMQGRIFDAVVDLRPTSKTFGEWYGVELSDNGKNQVYIAPGFAHGFCVLSQCADLHYKVSGIYDPADEGGLLSSDSDIGIEWPGNNFIINKRDAMFPPFSKVLNLL